MRVQQWPFFLFFFLLFLALCVIISPFSERIEHATVAWSDCAIQVYIIIIALSNNHQMHKLKVSPCTGGKRGGNHLGLYKASREQALFGGQHFDLYALEAVFVCFIA